MRSGLKDRIVDYFDNFSGSASNVTFYYNPVISLLVRFVWIFFTMRIIFPIQNNDVSSIYSYCNDSSSSL